MPSLVEIARTYLDTPFHHQARLKGVGIDCIGLLVCAAREAGFALHDFTDYARDPDPKQLLARLAEQLDRIEVADSVPGDVLCFWVTAWNVPQHVGFKTEHGIIHTYANIGRVVEHSYSAAWRTHTHSAWRLRAA